MIYYDTDRHLVADSRKELLAFMELVGIKRCWLHRWHGQHPHCDIPKRKIVLVALLAQLVKPRHVLLLSKAMAALPAHTETSSNGTTAP